MNLWSQSSRAEPSSSQTRQLETASQDTGWVHMGAGGSAEWMPSRSPFCQTRRWVEENQDYCFLKSTHMQLAFAAVQQAGLPRNNTQLWGLLLLGLFFKEVRERQAELSMGAAQGKLGWVWLTKGCTIAAPPVQLLWIIFFKPLEKKKIKGEKPWGSYSLLTESSCLWLQTQTYTWSNCLISKDIMKSNPFQPREIPKETIACQNSVSCHPDNLCKTGVLLSLPVGCSTVE